MVNLYYYKTSNNQRFIMFMWPLQRGEAHLWPSGSSEPAATSGSADETKSEYICILYN